MLKSKGFLSFVLLLFFVVFTARANAAMVLQLSDNQPGDYPTTVGDLKFAELVGQRTNGRIKN